MSIHGEIFGYRYRSWPQDSFWGESSTDKQRDALEQTKGYRQITRQLFEQCNAIIFETLCVDPGPMRVSKGGVSVLLEFWIHASTEQKKALERAALARIYGQRNLSL